MSESPASSEILRELRSFREMGTVLYIAAHPDDENTQLIAYLARGRNYRTGYLSLTRGDGGQNVLGPEFGDELGVIRTQELLAARRIDGGRQFFSRAIDFGFSKDYRETLRIWDHQQVLSDIVRVIREFQPDILITRFPPQPGGTHGHHTASTILALEAFKLAGNPEAFPEQLKDLKPWQPRRILWNTWRGFGRPEPETNAAALQVDVSGNDPVSGESFSSIAARSRSMHKTQGFGNFTGFGGRGPRAEYFQLLEGEPATNDIMDGVETTWARVPGGADLGRISGEILTNFNALDPSASVPALLDLRARLARLPSGRLVDEKRGQLDRILQACLGLSVQTTIPQAEVVPGEQMRLRHTATVQSSVPVRWLGARYPGIGRESEHAVELRPGQTSVLETTEQLPANTPLTQPYWLRAESTVGMFRVEDPSLIGRPENPPAFPVEQIFEVGGQKLAVPDEPVQFTTHSGSGELRERLEVIPPVSLSFPSDVKLFTPGSTRSVSVEIAASRADAGGDLQLEAPEGWKVVPEKQAFQLGAPGSRKRVSFEVTAPAQPSEASITAVAEVHGVRYDNRRVEIRYAHIPFELLQPPARVKAVSLQLATRGRRIGYIPGAGDSVAECLAQMGYEVTALAAPDLTPETLKKFDAIVVGIRAFNVRKDLAAQTPVLFGYVQSGGNLIVQYNNPNGLQGSKLAPYDLHISNDRVTDEEAPVTFLAPADPVLNVPNRITSRDFDGWVQERGLYFANEWDDHFKPILACNDPGEPPRKGGLLVAQYGRGYFTYTGLAWFRQLPAGVPGAYRLFANLVSLGKDAASESHELP